MTISDAYPRRGCATETMTVLIILTKINKIAPHPLAHPVISDVQLDVAFQIPSDVMETTIVETVLVRFFFDLVQWFNLVLKRNLVASLRTLKRQGIGIVFISPCLAKSCFFLNFTT